MRCDQQTRARGELNATRAVHTGCIAFGELGLAKVGPHCISLLAASPVKPKDRKSTCTPRVL